MNRWLFGLEVIIRRISAGYNSQLVASQEEQLINSIIVSTLIRILYMSTSTDPLAHLSIWLGKRRGGEREGESEASNKNIKGKRG